ncbi:MAG TPA: hypothetical protein PKI59_04115, partial [Candidatus Cloacimonadota bacterium]|nr:hypothetical protein [Candidatus Cloacimonadota bacterium]
GADLISEAGDIMRGRVDYLYGDGRNLHSEYTGVDAHLYSGDVIVSGKEFSDVITQLGAYRIWQKNASQRFDQSGLNFLHKHSVDIGALKLKNRLMIAMGKLGLHSQVSLPVPYLDITEFHLMVDKRNFIPSLGFRWSYVPDFDQLLTISNSPQLESQDYNELLRQYRWVSQSQGYNAKLPLNLSIVYETQFPLNRDFQLKRISVENSTQYALQQVTLQSGVNPLIPSVNHTDIAHNRSQISASFGEGDFQFQQVVFTQLAYLSRHNWIRAAYQPVFGMETEATYRYESWNTGITLHQHYFSRDHLGRDLPEVIDLSLKAEYHYAKNSSIYLYANNLLNRRRWVFRTLPAEGINLYAGAKHRF